MPRHMEVALCGLGLLVVAPLLACIAIVIKTTSTGPILFRQSRLGQHGRLFEMLKFRSMVNRPQIDGPQITASGDLRITPVGRVLRRFKIDELPQLWNVMRGDMALVGPRPEVPRYAEHYPDLFDIALLQRPGITDICTLQLRNEEQLLATVDESERYYVQFLLPRKLAASIREGWKRTCWRDLRVIIGTVVPVLCRFAPRPDFRPLAGVYALTGEQLRREIAEVRPATAAHAFADHEPAQVKIGA